MNWSEWHMVIMFGALFARILGYVLELLHLSDAFIQSDLQCI